MDMTFTPEDHAFREEVRSFIAAAMTPDIREAAEKGGGFSHEQTMEWHRILAEKGWSAPHWPEEHGGTGWDATKRFIFNEEMVHANAPSLSPFGLGMVGPLLIQFGTEEQKARFLPKILTGEETWCQGYSEPNAGSDLASLQLRADKDGDDYVLNGQKTWTSAAQDADWIFLLCRTSSAGQKQDGITFLLADMKTPGIEAKPFLTLGGTLAFCDTYFSDARVPQANRVGPEGGGWTMAKALLGHERTGIGGISTSARWLSQVKRLARETPVGAGTLWDDESFRLRLARLEMRHRALAMANYRTLAAAQLGHAPGPESSILKLVGTELLQEVTELALDALGPAAQVWLGAPEGVVPDFARQMTSEFNYLRAATIYGGSNEIQKNIICKAILGLPDPLSMRRLKTPERTAPAVAG
ncbi:MAG TPA: acyl-CoA dehydrogenase family protein [Thermoanaerobaculia bacterium]|nr:acyl-CoA dehydrogenase family protein [Thermoanaerobaculia bacterium]